jgi:hypothetical protein
MHVLFATMLPGVQGMQSVMSEAPSFSVTVSGGQAVHRWAPKLAKVPGGQVWQPPRPRRSLKVPSGHMLHSALPSGAKVPGAHGSQAETFVAPCVGSALPIGHGVHVSDPSVGLKKPGRQGAQTPIPA